MEVVGYIVGVAVGSESTDVAVGTYQRVPAGRHGVALSDLTLRINDYGIAIGRHRFVVMNNPYDADLVCVGSRSGEMFRLVGANDHQCVAFVVEDVE